MSAPLRVALVGDRDDAVAAHRAIPLALERAGRAAGVGVDPVWLATPGITDAAALDGYDAVWCVPASPYRSMDGALRAIRRAREGALPFLGTCGGFQHAVLEVARNLLGWADAEHAETAPQAPRPVIAPLSCALVEARERVRLAPGSRLARAYGRDEADEAYRCRYGLNPRFEQALLAGPLRAAAHADGEVRAVELDAHPYFVATLFQPERAALEGRDAPLVHAFIEAALARRANATGASA